MSEVKEENIYNMFRKKNVEKLRLMFKHEKEGTNKTRYKILCRFCRESGAKLTTAEDYYKILKGEGLIVSKGHKWIYEEDE